MQELKYVVYLFLCFILFFGFSGCTQQVMDNLKDLEKSTIKSNDSKNVTMKSNATEIAVTPNNGNTPPPLPGEVDEDSSNNGGDNDMPPPPPND